MNTDRTVSRPALRYYGGKWVLAPWIIEHFPEHQQYLEPCGGAASVLLRKPRAPLETYNDVYGEVTNFFKVLRDQPDALLRQISLTPWSRRERDACYAPTEDPIESARRFYFIAQASISASTRRGSGMRMVYRLDGGVPARINALPDHLWEVAGRLLGVQFENRDALDLIRLADTPQTLIYFDPPYLQSMRTQRNEYAHEVDEDFHRKAAEVLKACVGMVVVSGYSCPLYRDLYEQSGWQRCDKETRGNAGAARVESLWLNSACQQAKKEQQP